MKHKVTINREILFTGTSHIDPDGYSRLSQVLERHGPGMILLEVSPMSIILRRTYGLICRTILNRNLKKLGPVLNPGIRSITGYLDIPDEYRAVRSYCSRTGAEYRLVDVSIISVARFFHAYKLVTKKNITLTAAIHDDRFMQETAIARNIFTRNDSVLLNMKLNQFRKDPLAVYREKILLRRVIKHVNKNSGMSIMYVGGWEHLMDLPGSGLLYSEFPGAKRRTIPFLDFEDDVK